MRSSIEVNSLIEARSANKGHIIGQHAGQCDGAKAGTAAGKHFTAGKVTVAPAEKRTVEYSFAEVVGRGRTKG